MSETIGKSPKSGQGQEKPIDGGQVPVTTSPLKPKKLFPNKYIGYFTLGLKTPFLVTHKV